MTPFNKVGQFPAEFPWEFLQPFAFSLPETGGASVVHYNRKTPLELSLAGFFSDSNS
jgi:hypothetical protein